jgi:hypothetical protein
MLIYWESRIHHITIDWGKPTCFACGRFFGYDRNGEPVDPKGWERRLEKAHLIASRYGGPEEAWNLIFMCAWCHNDMDQLFSGKPEDYDKALEWLPIRHQFFFDSFVKGLKTLFQQYGFYPCNEDFDWVEYTKLNHLDEIVEEAHSLMPVPPLTKHWSPIEYRLHLARLALEKYKKAVEV